MRGFLAVSLALVSLLLNGCGGCGDDHNGRLPDAPPLIDAAPDTPVPPDAPVVLTVTLLGQPQIGVHVYFVNADNSLVKTVDTDATGSASAVMAAGGSVTALNPFVPPPPALQGPLGKVATDELRSFVGVKPGDHLVLSRADTTFVNFQLNATAATNATNYDVFTTCGTGTITPGGGSGGSGSPDPGGPLSLQNCKGKADIAIVASNRSDGTQFLSGLFHADQTLPADGTSDGTVDLTADTYGALTTIDFTYMNAPDATLNVQHAPIVGHGLLGPFPVDASGGAGTVREPTIPGVTKAVVDTTLFLNGQHDVVDWGDFTVNYQLDLANLLLADITTGPTITLETGELAWTEAGSGATPDLSVAGVTLRRVEPTLRRWHWEIAVPHPATAAIALPHLPTDVFDWTPAASDEIIGLDPVTSAKVPGGYDAVRAHILDLLDGTGPLGFVLGASGRAVTVQSRPPPQ